MTTISIYVSVKAFFPNNYIDRARIYKRERESLFTLHIQIHIYIYISDKSKIKTKQSFNINNEDNTKSRDSFSFSLRTGKFSAAIMHPENHLKEEYEILSNLLI